MNITDLRGHFSLREFIVDFFGALMPGVLFLLFLALSFFVSMACAISILQCTKGDCNQMHLFITGLKNFIISLRSVGILALFMLFLSVGYAIGTLFYRRDPRYPDYRSFLKIASKFSGPEEFKNWVVRVKKKEIVDLKKRLKELRIHNRLYHRLFTFRKAKKNLLHSSNQPGDFIVDPKSINILTVKESEVQYPYNNLYNFLAQRGRKDLAKRVNWSTDEHEHKMTDNTHNKVSPRSKTFINSLKIRLQFRYPEKSSTVIKNEAHIRLTSSMWYAATALLKFSFTGLFMLVLAILIAQMNYTQFLHYIPPLILNTGIIWLAYTSRRSSEKFLHYQRVREIFYVMETAELANQMDKDKKAKNYYFKSTPERTPIESDN